MLAAETLLHPSYHIVPLSRQVYSSVVSLFITDKNISIATCLYSRIFLTFVVNVLVLFYFIANIRALTTQHPLPAKVGTNFADKRRRSVGIVRLRAKATEFSLSF
jgi:hypothetical protein